MHSKKIYKFWPVITLIAIFLAVVLLRFYRIDARMIHIDEGMGLRYGQLMFDGAWHYNPYNSHGPIYFFFGSLIYGLFGYDLVAARAGTALISMLWLTALLWLYWPLLRTPGRLLLAAGLGLSSGMVFFARDFIHEHIFILMTVGALVAAEMWVRHRDFRAPLSFVLLCVLMYATKETALLTWAAWGIAAVLLLLKPGRQHYLFKMNWKSVALGIYLGLMLYALLFTVFFTDPMAFINSFIGPLKWLDRAQVMHQRPFLYFVGLLFVREFPLVLGTVGLGWWLTSRKKWTSRLAFYALWAAFITLIYSLISYKTPWCIPNLILPLGLFVAFAFDALWITLKKRQKQIWLLVAVVILAAGTVGAWYDSVIHPDRVLAYDYAYLQSDNSLGRFIQTLKDLNNLYDGEKPMTIQRIGYTDELVYVLSNPYHALDSSQPLQLGLPVYINFLHDDKETLDRLKQSGKNYIRSTYMYIRDQGTVIDLFVEEGLWNRYLTEVAHEQVLPGENPLYDYSK
jgi:uncharacterized protein (TIGR03663 family)